MPASSPGQDPFAEWFRDHAVALATLDPDPPLDDLEPLREVVGDALRSPRLTASGPATLDERRHLYRVVRLSQGIYGVPDDFTRPSDRRNVKSGVGRPPNGG